MLKDQIPAFVNEILATGATLYAVGDSYVFGDTEETDLTSADVISRVNSICEKYGPRDHLRGDITDHLTSLGRVIDVHDQGHVRRWIVRSAHSTATESQREWFARLAEDYGNEVGELSTKPL